MDNDRAKAGTSAMMPGPEGFEPRRMVIPYRNTVRGEWERKWNMSDTMYETMAQMNDFY